MKQYVSSSKYDAQYFTNAPKASVIISSHDVCNIQHMLGPVQRALYNSSSQKPREVGIITSILKMGKLRLREVQ